jgi:hypothetical protein
MRSENAITNVDIAVFALARLGGASKKVHSEDIAATAHELAPARFSWQRPVYRDRGWPDKYIVKTALEDAKKAEYGKLVDGSYANDVSKDGWRLTAAGSQWIMANEQRIREGLSVAQPGIPNREAQRFCKKLKGELLFRKFSEDGNLDGATRYQFTDLLECSPDAPKQTMQMKFDRLQATAYVVQDETILAFLSACRSRFSEFLTAT